MIPDPGACPFRNRKDTDKFVREIGKSFYTFEKSIDFPMYELILHRVIKSVKFIKKKKSKTKQECTN